MTKVPEETLERAENKAIEAANRVIELWGEEEGARILRICQGVYERKIKDCEQIASMRVVYIKRCEGDCVPTPTKKFVPQVIQGGLA